MTTPFSYSTGPQPGWVRASRLPPSACVRSSHAARRAQWRRTCCSLRPTLYRWNVSISRNGTGWTATPAPSSLHGTLRAACRTLQTRAWPLPSLVHWTAANAPPGSRLEAQCTRGQGSLQLTTGAEEPSSTETVSTPPSTPGHYPALPSTTSSSASFAFFFFNESNKGRLGDATAKALWLTKSSPCSCWRSRRQHRPHLRLPIGRLQ